MRRRFMHIIIGALSIAAIFVFFPHDGLRIVGSLGGGWCTETYVYGGGGPENVAESPPGTCTFQRYHYMVVHCPVGTSIHIISCTLYDAPQGGGQVSGDCMYKFNQSGTDENGAPYYIGQPLYYMGTDSMQSAKVVYECITYNGNIGGDGGSSDVPVSSAASFNSQASQPSSIGVNNVSSPASPSSVPPSSAPASSAVPSSQPPASSAASSVCSNCVTASSSQNSSRPSSTPNPSSTSSACSFRPEVPVVCGDAPDVCSDPPGRQAACSQSCIDAELTCRLNFYAQQTSVRNPQGCQYAEPFPNLYEACTTPRLLCECNCQVNIVPSLCRSSASSASSASTVACPEAAFCGTTKECAQANASYVIPPSFCGTADAGTRCCVPKEDECPAGYSCMDKQVCLDKGGVNNGTGMCGGADSTTCCKLTNSSNSSQSSTGEEWVFTPCAGDTKANPVLCVMGTPGQQTCPGDTVPQSGTCKNTKYENGVLVAQQVGICCGPKNQPSSASSTSHNSSAASGIYCCLPSLNHSCLLVSTPQVCTQSQGIPGGSTLAGCQQTCKGDSSSSSSRSSSSASVIVDPPPSSRSSTSPGSTSSSSSRSSSSSSRIVDSSSSRSNSSQSSIIIVGGQCLGNECANGGNTLCALTGKTCALTNTFPCLICTGGSSSNNSSNSSIIVVVNPSSHSSSISLPFLECSGNECAQVGNAFCALQNLSCIPQSTTPCFTCGTTNSSDSSASSNPNCTENNQCASHICENGTCQPPLLPPGSPCTNNNQCTSFICENNICQEPLPPGFPCTDNRQCSTNLCKDGICQNPLPLNALAFLGETCTENFQCITNLCINNLCTACTDSNQCSSHLCRNGICLNNNLPNGAACSEDAQCLSGLCLNNICTDPSTLPATTVIDPITGKPLFSSPNDTLPATVIELPFTDSNPSSVISYPSRTTDDGQLPDTGPAALAIMIAGGAAGWVYRRRK